MQSYHRLPSNLLLWRKQIKMEAEKRLCHMTRIFGLHLHSCTRLRSLDFLRGLWKLWGILEPDKETYLHKNGTLHHLQEIVCDLLYVPTNGLTATNFVSWYVRHFIPPMWNICLQSYFLENQPSNYLEHTSTSVRLLWSIIMFLLHWMGNQIAKLWFIFINFKSN